MEKQWMPSPQTLFGKIMFSSIVIILIPVIGLTIFYLNYQRSLAVESEIGYLKTFSMGVAHKIDLYLAGNLLLVKQLSFDKDLQEYLYYKREDLKKNVKWWLEINKKLSNNFDSIYALDKQGRCLVSSELSFESQDYSMRPYFIAARNGDVHISDFLIGITSSRPGIYFSTPVYYQQEFCGVIVLKLKVNEIKNTIKINTTSNLSFFLINSDGIILAHSKEKYVYQSLAKLSPTKQAEIRKIKQFASTKIKSLHLPILMDAHQRVQKTGKIETTYYRFEEHDKVALLCRLNSRPWTLGVAKPVKSIYINCNFIMCMAILLTIFLCVSSIFFGHYLIKQITEPIKLLLKAVVSFGEGNTEVELPIKTNDEIGKLTLAFNQMTRIIKDYTCNLEDKIREHTRRLEIAYEKIKELSVLDPLTGVYNRRYLNEKMGTELKEALENNLNFSVILSDLDHFKLLNDNYGHQAGDRVLKEFAATIKEVVRAEIDWICRYGGEEFLIILPKTSVEKAFLVAERIRNLAMHKKIPWRENILQITASFGVAGIESNIIEKKVTIDELIELADRMLYRAKRNGRNQSEASVFQVNENRFLLRHERLIRKRMK